MIVRGNSVAAGYRKIHLITLHTNIKYASHKAFVSARKRAAIRHRNYNIPAKSSLKNLLANIFHPLLLVLCRSYAPPSANLLNQWKCSDKPLMLKIPVLYSQSAPEFCAARATLAEHWSQCPTQISGTERGKDSLISAIKGTAVIQNQMKAQSLGQPI